MILCISIASATADVMDGIEDCDGKEWVAAVQEFDVAKAAVGAELHPRVCEMCHSSGGSYADDDASLLAGQWMPHLRQKFADYASGDRGMLDKAMKEKIDPLNAESIYERQRLCRVYGNPLLLEPHRRAVCSGCQVPKDWFHKAGRQVVATMHAVRHWFTGSIDTRDKYEAQRLYLAKHVWEDIKGSDSDECRDCHELGHMDLNRQKLSASRKHTLKRQIESGETCIDCQQGVAHTLSEGWQDQYDAIAIAHEATKEGETKI